MGGATDPVLRRAQISCLEGTNETTGLLLDTLSNGDPTLAVFAVDDVAITSNLEPCRDTTRLARLPMPDEEVHAAVAEAQSQLRRAAILHKTGELDAAYVLTTGALAELESAGFERGTVSAKVRLGALQVERGELEKGRAQLEEAFYAAGALDDDESAAEAARHLVGMGPQPEPYGIVWIRGWFAQAQMLHARLGLSESFEQAEICEALGAHLASLDDPQTLAEERRLLRRARDIRLAKVGPDHPAVVVAELNLAMYGAEDDPEGTLAKLRNGRDRLEQAFGARHPLMVMQRLMAAEVMSTAGDREGAAAEANRALELAIEVHGAAHPQTEYVRELRDELVAP